MKSCKGSKHPAEISCILHKMTDSGDIKFSSKVYCNPQLLDVIQTAGLYPDSKVIVDKPLKASPDEVLQAFQRLPCNPSKEMVQQFVNNYFGEEGKELEQWCPADFTERPELLTVIQDDNLRRFASDLNQKWRLLGRRVKNAVKENPERYSILYVPEPFIIPGGRFRELYYWDSYWIVKGLLACGMKDTVRGMITNILSLVERCGFMPNGSRVYYLNRSQPPFLVPMFDSYMQATGDTGFLKTSIHILSKEYSYWLDNHTISVTAKNGKVYEASMYRVHTDIPRPESYIEDKLLASDLPEDGRRRLYSNLASAAESGWDFSSRWYDPKMSSRDLRSISTLDKIPVDLNAYLCWNAKLLANMYDKLGNEEKTAYYKAEYQRRQTVLDELLWDEGRGAWLDFYLNTKTHDTRFYVSVITPLFTGCHGSLSGEQRRKTARVLEYIERELPDYVGGVPTSLIDSTQQWDFPNVWPPLIHMWIHALWAVDDQKAKRMALQTATKWIISNYTVWSKSGNMYEKYDARTGLSGDGGEYQVQVGFGWSNGVILDLLKTFPMLAV